MEETKMGTTGEEESCKGYLVRGRSGYTIFNDDDTHRQKIILTLKRKQELRRFPNIPFRTISHPGTLAAWTFRQAEWPVGKP